MKIGIPREIKPEEGRVALLPKQVQVLVADGNKLMVEVGCGRLSGAQDQDYLDAGATLVDDLAAVYRETDLIVKVKEILPPEFALLRQQHVLFTNLHSAGDRPQLDCLLATGLTAIAAENTHKFGSPNCPLAGEIAALEGVRLVFSQHGGSGRHFMAHYGAPAARALVIGLGNVGQGALRTLLSLGIEVVGFDLYPGARRQAELHWHDRAFSTDYLTALENYLPTADIIINSVLWDKNRQDHLIRRDMLGLLKSSAVIVDVSCDTAGAVETCHPVSWSDPVYVVDGIRHFCVDNIPGAVPVTASAGYAAAILPHIQQLAALGPIAACQQNSWLARGLTCHNGELLLEEAGRLQQRPYTPVAHFLDVFSA